MKSAQAIAFEVAPSRRLVYLLVSLALAAMLAVTLSGVPHADIWRGMILLGTVVSATRYARTGTWRVAWREDGTWGVADARSVASEATLAGWSRIGHFAALRLTLASGRRLSLLLLPDNVDAVTRRRLVVRLARGEAAQAAADVSLLP
ncbi:protein YgfX [Tahibacter soli]|uniref:Toxin CptA n=1 Tax=Tahibacter soli TaxID=2983605 RepID=A0A9X4BJA9_9GAMM|nr:protein YgfX [Tahibacter soli]MDC8013062.1 hypothetical protein [Tahibacter soli]